MGNMYPIDPSPIVQRLQIHFIQKRVYCNSNYIWHLQHELFICARFQPFKNEAIKMFCNLFLKNPYVQQINAGNMAFEQVNYLRSISLYRHHGRKLHRCRMAAPPPSRPDGLTQFCWDASKGALHQQTRGSIVTPPGFIAGVHSSGATRTSDWHEEGNIPYFCKSHLQPIIWVRHKSK